MIKETLNDCISLEEIIDLINVGNSKFKGYEIAAEYIIGSSLVSENPFSESTFKELYHYLIENGAKLDYFQVIDKVRNIANIMMKNKEI